MARSFVFTLGFHEDFAIRRLSSKAAGKGEPIVAFTAKPAVAAVRKAFSSLEGYCATVGLSRPVLVEVDLSDSASALVAVRSALEGLPEPVVADLSGGMRALVLAVVLALFTLDKDFELYASAEAGEAPELHVPRGVARAFSSLSKEKREILRLIAREPGVGVEALARRLGKAAKTVRNHVSELRRMGLVVSKGRGGALELTSWGRALAGIPASGRE